MLVLGLASACAPQDEVLRPVVETVPIPTTEPAPSLVATTTTQSSSDVPETEPTTDSTAPSVPATFLPGSGGPEPEGLPPFMVAVRSDSAVIEIDTSTGRTARILIPPPQPDPPDAEIEGNRIGQVWWNRETGQMVVEEGPEPAGGNIVHLPVGAEYAVARDRAFGDTPGFASGGGWQAAMSPNGRYTLHTGYAATILETGVQRDSPVRLVEPVDDGFSFTPAWLRDRVGVAYTSSSFGEDPINELRVIEMNDLAEVVTSRAIEIEGEAAGLAVRADGALVLLLDSGDPSNWGGTDALVIDPDSGETIAEFTLEPGSHSLGYDTTGTYLLYVDGEGTARWRGRGQSGTIASDLLHADW